MKKSGFTLLELMVVVIIIGILAMIALPQFFRATERARAAEGTNVLGSLRSAQMRYYAESDKQVYATDVQDLDMEYGNLKYFGNITVSASAHDVNGCGLLGSVERTGGDNLNYTLKVYEKGIITCEGNGCPAGLSASCE